MKTQSVTDVPKLYKQMNLKQKYSFKWVISFKHIEFYKKLVLKIHY